MNPEFTNYMQLALAQAFYAVGESRPNPAVGAVVVKDGIVVGKGRTQRPGSAHAEVMALRDAGELARGASIYVTLEPCCHYGRTPPCTKAIIDAGIREVYFAHADPNPQVRGKSRRVLEEAGIKVFEGLDACVKAEVPDEMLSQDEPSLGECKVFGGGSFLQMNGLSQMNRLSQMDCAGAADVFHEIERFFEAYDYFVRNKRPFVEIKSAVSQDFYMAVMSPEGNLLPVKITDRGADCWNHRLRAMSDVILVGAGTALADNPGLDVRFADGNSPLKAVWAGRHVFTAEEKARLKILQGACLVYSCCAQPNLESVPPNSESVPPNLESVPPNSERSSSDIESARTNSDRSVEVVVLSAGGFRENWNAMLDDMGLRGMHRLMVEPGVTLARLLLDGECAARSNLNSAQYNKTVPSNKTAQCNKTVPSNPSAAPASPLWNRLDLWQSTSGTVESALDSDGTIEGVRFPELPDGIVARESAMIGPDVLTVYYPSC